MAIRLRRPGTSFPVEMKDGARAWIRVLRIDQFFELEDFLKSENSADMIRNVLSLVLDRVEGIEIGDEGAEFQVARDAQGQLTEDTVSALLPVATEIMTLATKAYSFDSESDRKN